MTTGAELRLPDGESLADLATYVRRAARLDGEGAIRLQASAGVRPVLAAWVCVLPGHGLLRSGLVLGLRTMALAGWDDGHGGGRDVGAGADADGTPRATGLDTTVPLAGLTDRFARRAATGDASTTLSLPPTTLAPAWAAQSPPRGGWEPMGGIPAAELAEVAQAGIAEVATGAPEGSGAAAVEALRAQVWGRRMESCGVPAGAALDVHALGFARPEPATVHRSGPWWRVSTPIGHVVLRP